MKYQKLKIVLYFADSSEADISGLLVPDSYRERFTLCGSEKMSTLNSISFSLRYNLELMLKLVKERSKIDIKVHEIVFNDCIFSGQLDPVANVSISSHKDVSSFNLEAVDESADLDRPILEDISWPESVGATPYVLYNPAALSSSIIYLLLSMAGWSDRIAADAPMLNFDIKHLALSADDYTYRELLDELLFEYRHVLYCNQDGTITWKPWIKDTVDTDRIFTEDDILSSPALQINRRYIPEKGITVFYTKPSIVENARLWEAGFPIEGDSYTGEPVAAGDYWPEDSDLVETWQNYRKDWLDIPYLKGENRLKNDDISLIATSDWELRDQRDDEIVLDPVSDSLTVDYRAKRARLRYKNEASEAKKIYYTKIYGRALIRSAKLKCSLPVSRVNPKEYTSKHIYSEWQAEELAKALYQDQLYGDVEYTFTSSTNYSPGFCVLFEHSGMNITTLLFITQRETTRGTSNLFTYTALGVSELEQITAEHTGGIVSSNQIQPPLQLKSQYAASSTGPWHETPTSSDIYIRTSSDGGFTWSAALKFRDDSLYTWIKYADDATGGGMSDDPAGKDYIGIAYNKTTPTESTNAADYQWSLYKGPQGVPGADGDSLYTWIKYADDASGSNMEDDPAGKDYIGIAYNKTTPTESTNAADYQWSLYKGPQGVPGADGEPAPEYLGALENVPATPNEKDFFLYVGTTTGGWEEGKYYKYLNGSWQETEESYVLMAGLADALEYAKAQPNLYAAIAWINLLFAQNILLASGGSVRSEKYNADGTEVTGGPETGFYLGSDGKLIARNVTIEKGTVKGRIEADSGYFKGYMQTEALTLKPGEATNVAITASSDGGRQAKNIWDFFTAQGYSEDAFYRATINTDSSVYFFLMRFENTWRVPDQGIYEGDYVSTTHIYIDFYDSSYTLIQTLRSSYSKISRNLYTQPDSMNFSDGDAISPSVTVTAFRGGDKIIASSAIPTSPTGLDDYQVWLDGEILKVNLPS